MISTKVQKLHNTILFKLKRINALCNDIEEDMYSLIIDNEAEYKENNHKLLLSSIPSKEELYKYVFCNFKAKDVVGILGISQRTYYRLRKKYTEIPY